MRSSPGPRRGRLSSVSGLVGPLVARKKSLVRIRRGRWARNNFHYRVPASGPEADADTADSMDRQSQARQRIRRTAIWWARVILVPALALLFPPRRRPASCPTRSSAPDAVLCAKMVFRPPMAEDPSDTPFCRAFRQFQVIEVRGAWARIGSDVWIETAVLTNPALLQRSDPRVSRTPNLRAINRTASREG